MNLKQWLIDGRNCLQMYCNDVGIRYDKCHPQSNEWEQEFTNVDPEKLVIIQWMDSCIPKEEEEEDWHGIFNYFI